MEKLMDFKKGTVIMMGDLNFCMDPGLNSTSRVQGTRNVLLKMIKQKMHQHQLLDV